MKFLQNSFQTFLNVKYWLSSLIDMVLTFQLKVLKENTGKHQTEDSTCIQQIKIIDITEKFKSHFKVTLGIRTIKTT